MGLISNSYGQVLNDQAYLIEYKKAVQLFANSQYEQAGQKLTALSDKNYTNPMVPYAYFYNALSAKNKGNSYQSRVIFRSLFENFYDWDKINEARIIYAELNFGENYFEEIIYQSGLTLSDLTRLIKEKVPERATIYADAAEPKSIEELYRQGFNIKPAQKDVWAGIVKMKSYPINIHFHSKNLKREFMSYKWKKDKNDNVIEEPVKANDDALDASRYAVFTHLTKLKFEVSVF